MGLDRRRFIAGGLASLTALASGCGRVINLVETYNLSVTDGNTHPYTFLTQKEGEKQLQDLACSLDTKTEDAWGFIRDVNKDEGKWVDTCFSLRKDSCRFDINLLLKEVNKGSFRKVLDVTAYHIHPLFSVLDCYNELYGENELKELGQCELEVFSIPEYRDMLGHIWLEHIFGSLFSGEKVSLKKSKVVVPTGIFTYRDKGYFRNLCRNNGSDYIIDNVFLPAILEGVNNKDINRSLEVLRDKGIDITYERTKVFDEPVPLNKFNLPVDYF